MAEVQQNSNSLIAWIALIVAIIALVLGWMAFNRSGQDVVPAVQEGAQEAQEDAALLAARTEARAELLALQTQIAAEEGYDEAAQQAAEIEADLETAYVNARLEASAEWQELQADFENLERELRDESADAAETVAGLIALLGQDLRTDER